MNKTSVRSFGLAIFLVGAIISIADRFDVNIGLPTVASSTETDVEVLQQKLEAANKEINALKKQVTQQVSSDKQSEEIVHEEATKDNTDKSTPKDAITMTLQIYSGITPYIVAQKLEDGGVISNSVEMELLLANAKYARSLQIGTYEVNSSMSLDEIAKLITGKQ